MGKNALSIEQIITIIFMYRMMGHFTDMQNKLERYTYM